MNQSENNLYGIRFFDDMKTTVFLLDVLCKANIYNLFAAYKYRNLIKNSEGNYYLCSLTDKQFISKMQDGTCTHYFFLVSEYDKKIIHIDNRKNFFKAKASVMETLEPHIAEKTLQFKVHLVVNVNDLYNKTYLSNFDPEESTLH
jgi:hypothetical protein